MHESAPYNGVITRHNHTLTYTLNFFKKSPKSIHIYFSNRLCSLGINVGVITSRNFDVWLWQPYT